MLFSLVSLKASEENREILDEIVEIWKECFEDDSKYYPTFDNLLNYFIEDETDFYALRDNNGGDCSFSSLYS